MPISAAGRSSEGSRPIARAVAVLGLWILGGLAAVRLPLEYLPVWTFPELEIRLRLPEGHDLEQITRELLQPIEASVRSIGGVRDMAGRIGEQGGDLRVRLAPGHDPESMAAWLDSELQMARRALPDGAQLRIEPAGRGREGVSSVLWLPEDFGRSSSALFPGASQAFAEALRQLPQVREVRLAGEEGQELWIRPLAGDSAGLRAHLEGVRADRGLGTVEAGGILARVRASGVGSTPLPEVPVAAGRGLLRLGGLASVELEKEEPRLFVRHRGQDGRAYLIYREPGVSPLALQAGLHRLLERWGLEGEARLLFDDAAPLRRLLGRLLAGLVGSCLVFGLAWGFLAGPRAGLVQALVPLTCLAGALVAAPLATAGLDVTTLPALALGVAAGLLFQVVRGPRRPEERCSKARQESGRTGARERNAFGLGTSARGVAVGLAWTLLSVFCLPVAVGLVGGSLAGLLSAPSLLFAVTAPAACAGGLLVPAPRVEIRGSFRTLLRWVLRRPWPLLLGGASFVYGVAVLFGGAMVPMPGSLSPLPADIGIDLDFGASRGATESAGVMARLEERLVGLREIRSHWSVTGSGWGYVGVWVEPESRALTDLRALADRLRSRSSGLGASARVAPYVGMGGREPLRFESSLGLRAEEDLEMGTFRFLLSSAEALPLRRAVETAEQELLALYWNPDREAIHIDWTPPRARFQLAPGPAVSPSTSRNVGAALAELTREPSRLGPPIRPLGDPRSVALRVAHPRAPSDPATVLDHRRALAPARAPATNATPSGVVSPAQLLELREVMAAPGIDRQGGSFVVPITVHWRGLALGEVPRARWQLIGTLRQLRLPRGVSLELPPPHRFWTPRRLRLVAIYLSLPLLVAALAICRLNSWFLGPAALAPLVLASAVAVLIVAASSSGLDEMGLMALAMALLASLPLGLQTAAAAHTPTPSRLAVGKGYRWLVRRLPVAAAVSAAWFCLLLLPTIGASADREPWALPLRSASAAGIAAVWASLLWLPVLLRAADQVRFHDSKAVRAKSCPRAWEQPGAVELEVRNLAKVYGNGFQALAGVSFRATPGLIGLLGPNGAGKSTLLRMLCGLLEPSRGQVLFRGLPVCPENLPRYRRLVGFLPQSFEAYAGFSAERFLDFWALELGIENPRERRREIEARLHEVGLADVADRRVRDLSGGMRRRIGIARALLGSPPILIVDEPTTGLDVASRNHLRESLLQVAADRIVLFSTHIASDLSAAASRILVLSAGRLLFDGPSARLVRRAQGRVFETLVDDRGMRELSSRFRITARVRTLEGIRVRAVAAPGVESEGRQVVPDLEEAYLARMIEAGVGTAVPGAPRRQGAGRQGVGARLLDLEGW